LISADFFDSLTRTHHLRAASLPFLTKAHLRAKRRVVFGQIEAEQQNYYLLPRKLRKKQFQNQMFPIVLC